MKRRDELLELGLSNSLTLFITRGLPGSGKSHFAAQMQQRWPEHRIRVVNKDSLRLMLNGGVYSSANEEFIRTARDVLIRAALENHYNVIVTDCNFGHEEALRGLADECCVHFEIVDFTDVSPEQCVQWDQRRLAMVGEEVIFGMYKRYIEKAGRYVGTREPASPAESVDTVPADGPAAEAAEAAEAS